MCWVYVNVCPYCKKEDDLPMDKVPCEAAKKDGKFCKKLKERVVEGEEAQYCHRCNKGRKLKPLSSKQAKPQSTAPPKRADTYGGGSGYVQSTAPPYTSA